MPQLIDFMQKKLERMLPHNRPLGGTVLIKYKDTDWSIAAPRRDMHTAYEYLRGKDDPDRKQMMDSVNKEIEEALPIVTSGKADHNTAMGLSQDIVIWFANEILEGRKSFNDVRQLDG